MARWLDPLKCCPATYILERCFRALRDVHEHIAILLNLAVVCELLYLGPFFLSYISCSEIYHYCDSGTRDGIGYVRKAHDLSTTVLVEDLQIL